MGSPGDRPGRTCTARAPLVGAAVLGLALLALVAPQSRAARAAARHAAPVTRAYPQSRQGTLPPNVPAQNIAPSPNFLRVARVRSTTTRRGAYHHPAGDRQRPGTRRPSRIVLPTDWYQLSPSSSCSSPPTWSAPCAGCRRSPPWPALAGRLHRGRAEQRPLASGGLPVDAMGRQLGRRRGQSPRGHVLLDVRRRSRLVQRGLPAGRRARLLGAPLERAARPQLPALRDGDRVRRHRLPGLPELGRAARRHVG